MISTMFVFLIACLLIEVRSYPNPDVSAVSAASASSNAGGTYGGTYGNENSQYGSLYGDNSAGTGAFVGPAGASAGTGGSFASAYAGASFPYPDYNSVPPHFAKAHAEYIESMQRHFAAMQAAHEESLRSSYGFHNGYGGVGASAYGSIGPQGGYGLTKVFPPPEGNIDYKFGDNIPSSGPVGSVSGAFPPPQGKFYGVSSFSSSGFSNINGKETSYKKSGVTVNDNGNITTYTSHDP